MTEADLPKADAGARADAVIIKDRIADSMFQQLLLRPDEYSVIATPNLNGDYVSDAAAAQVGGLGIAPGATSATAWPCSRRRTARRRSTRISTRSIPGSVILSGVMMFEYMGWNEAAKLIVRGLENAIKIEAGDLRSRATDARRDGSLDRRRSATRSSSGMTELMRRRATLQASPLAYSALVTHR